VIICIWKRQLHHQQVRAKSIKCRIASSHVIKPCPLPKEKPSREDKANPYYEAFHPF
jgi:hypothetical protein